jgi:hypothetical protein
MADTRGESVAMDIRSPVIFDYVWVADTDISGLQLFELGL